MKFYPRLYEGVADKYAEREFHIVDDAAFKFDQKFLKEQNPDLIGTITHSWNGNEFENPTNIYKNPKSLEHFGMFVRGVVLKNGDFYVADVARHVIHVDIMTLLIKKGILKGSLEREKLEDMYSDEEEYPRNFMCVQRVVKKNVFALSGSNIGLFNMPFIKAGEIKNPNIVFANKNVFELEKQLS